MMNEHVIKDGLYKKHLHMLPKSLILNANKIESFARVWCTLLPAAVEKHRQRRFCTKSSYMAKNSSDREVPSALE